jgi:transcriptional regulator with XRE-family HTH domain
MTEDRTGIVTRSVFSREYQSLMMLLVEARKERGITQRQLAERLGKDQSFVSKIERGVRRLDVLEFMEVTEAIGVDAFDLLRKMRRARGTRKR